MTRRRLDTEMVRRGLVGSRAEAEVVLRAGLVTVGGAPASKASSLVRTNQPVRLAEDRGPFASRAGEKLAAALERFGVDVGARDCLDAGASTGGFTDCLLRAGARRVASVDVGYGQLAWELRNDPRVLVLERTDVRTLTASMLGFAPSLVTADLSFISVRTVLPALIDVSASAAELVLLVKPQFEAGRRSVGEGGVVRDPAVWRRVLADVAEATSALDAPPLGAMASPIRGPAGNVEFLLHARRGAPRPVVDLDAAVAEGAMVSAR